MDLVSGRIAYLAGSVVVIQEKDGSRRQSHIINETKKAFTSVAFSKDGKTLLTGERLKNTWFSCFRFVKVSISFLYFRRYIVSSRGTWTSARRPILGCSREDSNLRVSWSFLWNLMRWNFRFAQCSPSLTLAEIIVIHCQ